MHRQGTPGWGGHTCPVSCGGQPGLWQVASGPPRASFWHTIPSSAQLYQHAFADCIILAEAQSGFKPHHALSSVALALITAWISSGVSLMKFLRGEMELGTCPQVPPATPTGSLLINPLPLGNNRQAPGVAYTFLSLLLFVQPLQQLPGAINHQAQSWSWESLSCKTNIFQIL